jgi:hypothetical protein
VRRGEIAGADRADDRQLRLSMIPKSGYRFSDKVMLNQ